MSENNDADARHAERMARKKAVIDERVRAADDDRGVLVVLTGNGKGKSSSAFGMVARALGHELEVGIVQFIKGQFTTGEESFFRRQPGVRYHVMGEGFTWETQDKGRDGEAARAAWEAARALLRDPEVSLVILDELHIVLKHGHLTVDEVLEDLAARPRHQSVVTTGRGAPAALCEAADTFTELKAEKHAFQAGVKAQRGVEL